MARKAPTKTKPEAPRRPRVPVAFKRTDVARAVRAARDADLSIGRIEISKSGCITIIPKTDAPQAGNRRDDVTNAQDAKRPA
jgi:hypothetical protein